MCLTRSVDNRLKQFFMGGEVRWGDMAFQGKGFRSLGQEAIYAGAIRLKRGAAITRTPTASWNGDVMAPVIRDLGMTLAMRHDEEAVAMILRAQMGKAGPPMSGKDLHTGDFAWGVLPAAAPLAVGSLSMAGMAMAFCDPEAASAWRCRSSAKAARRSASGTRRSTPARRAKLPAIFCLQNNQTALSTPVRDNSAARVFADKAAGYGIPGLTIDGTDPDEVAAAFTWAAERARAGDGPDADRSRRDAHVRPRASRRHAVSRQGSAAVVGLPPAARQRLRQSRALRVLGQARSDPDVCARASKTTA